MENENGKIEMENYKWEMWWSWPEKNIEVSGK